MYCSDISYAHLLRLCSKIHCQR